MCKVSWFGASLMKHYSPDNIKLLEGGQVDVLYKVVEESLKCETPGVPTVR